VLGPNRILAHDAVHPPKTVQGYILWMLASSHLVKKNSDEFHAKLRARFAVTANFPIKAPFHRVATGLCGAAIQHRPDFIVSHPYLRHSFLFNLTNKHVCGAQTVRNAFKAWLASPNGSRNGKRTFDKNVIIREKTLAAHWSLQRANADLLFEVNNCATTVRQGSA
jgi:hypothetical protein